MRLDWSSFHALSPRAVYLAKLILSVRAGDRASMTTRNDLQALRRFDRWLDAPDFNWTDFTLTLAEEWLAHGMRSMGVAGNDFAILRDLYRYGAIALRHDDFSPALLLKLEEIRAAGNAKGHAVRAADPRKGQFLPDEVEAVYEALREGRGTPQQRASVWLCLDVGRNAGQYTLLRNRDLIVESVVIPGEAPSQFFQLEASRQKKRSANITRRRWPISTELGELLLSLRQGADDDPLLWWLDGRDPEMNLGNVMQAWARTAQVRTPRIGGEIIHLNPRRFRVTMLTNAADEGATVEHLAELADHTDTQNVNVYVERSPLFLQRIAPKVDALYDPMVRRFRGEMLSQAEVTRRSLPVIPGFATQLPTLSLPGIGGCGKSGLCELAPPLTCYPCPHFVAFSDTDHRAVERALVEYMQELDERIALQIAPSLAAVREVIRVQAAQTGLPSSESMP